ncbi:MAG: DNA-3-methyladenine glycosylase 2 family protein [Oscillospiraceae bacterium]|nr:DNA-3-methyladenine glycosylase 2 family protein [Oscillospiraceae bacterium]
MTVKERKDCIEVSGFGEINLSLTLDCGQAFRWREENGVWLGTAFGRSVGVVQDENKLLFYGSSLEDVKKIWIKYFDLERDYESVLEGFLTDDRIEQTVRRSGTVRILCQEPWEALCSFIISQCNNIPRIKGIINTLCVNFGEELPGGSFTFPSAEIIASKTEEELSVLHAGYRTPYILAAARAVSMGEVDLSGLSLSPLDDARKALMSIRGVGRKVADCTLLFSMGFSEVFPVDRHISRAVKEMYPEGLPESFAAFPGLAQQYIFITRAIN